MLEGQTAQRARLETDVHDDELRRSEQFHDELKKEGRIGEIRFSFDVWGARL